MSKYIYVYIILILLFSLLYTAKKKKAIESKWKDAVVNVKSHSHQFSYPGDKDGAFKLTTEQLGSSRDPIFQELEKAKRELKVKDSKLKSLMYVSSSFGKPEYKSVKDVVVSSKRETIN